MSSLPFTMVGAAGRMGRTIIDLSWSYGAADGRSLRLVGALENSESPVVGTDILREGASTGIRITDQASSALEGAAVVIDFSKPENTLAISRVCREKKTAMVVGTTGFSESQRKQLEEAAADIPILISPNMSVGVNLLFFLTGLAARRLAEGYALEIVDIHHRHKKDAPSGTALRLKEVLLEGANRTEDDVVYGRHGLTGERPPREIGVHTLRGGDVVGDHTVLFLGEGERIELTHRATSRNTFASGALRAALFVVAQKPGLYTMSDVLDLGSP